MARYKHHDYGQSKLIPVHFDRKSNLTDNDSAKMASSHGVLQGYLGVTVVDSAHQIIVNAQAFGEAQKHALLRPMLEGVR